MKFECYSQHNSQYNSQHNSYFDSLKIIIISNKMILNRRIMSILFVKRLNGHKYFTMNGEVRNSEQLY